MSSPSAARAPRAGRAAAALAVLLAAGCGGRATAPARVEAAARAVVARGELAPRWILTGQLAAVRAERIVVPRTPTWQMQIRWLEADGASVVAGQKVVELDNSQFAGELEQNRIAAARADNDRMQRQADLDVELADRHLGLERARIELEKARLRAEVPLDIVARREYQERQLALAKATIALETAREDLEATRKAATAELEELSIAARRAAEKVRVAERAIESLSLRAPTDGIVVIEENPQEPRKLQVGDSVWIGLTVATIPDLGEMQVEAALSDVDDGKIAVGEAVRCVVDAFPDRAIGGRIETITPVARSPEEQSARRAFHVLVSLEETDAARMRPGMSVRVEVLPAVRAAGLLVPRGALDLGGTAPRARLADGSDVEVRLGACDAQRCVVEAGLSEGQAVRLRS